MSDQLLPGDVARYSRPINGEEARLRFTLLELRGGRALIELRDSGMRIVPTEVVAIDEIEKVMP